MATTTTALRRQIGIARDLKSVGHAVVFGAERGAGSRFNEVVKHWQCGLARQLWPAAQRREVLGTGLHGAAGRAGFL